jgi:hypothetical protein
MEQSEGKVTTQTFFRLIWCKLITVVPSLRANNNNKIRRRRRRKKEKLVFFPFLFRPVITHFRRGGHTPAGGRPSS